MYLIISGLGFVKKISNELRMDVGKSQFEDFYETGPSLLSFKWAVTWNSAWIYIWYIVYRNTGYRKLLEYLFWMQDPQLSNGAHQPGHLLEEGFLEAEAYSVSRKTKVLYLYLTSQGYLMIPFVIHLSISCSSVFQFVCLSQSFG